ncbi:MAG: Gfo/Idh/MocA family protein [Thermoguttaceae bacterium]
MSTKPTRRRFLGTSAGVAAAAWAGARPYAAGAAASPGPNETVNMALIGCGGQGRYDMAQFMALPGVRVIAVCDVHALRMAEAQKQAGGQRVLTYKDYRNLLENKDIHAVIVGTIGHWHVLPTVDACKAGKDVYVEKPLGTSIGEGRAAVEAAKKYDRIVQIGTQQHSQEHYQKAVALIQAGKLGDITEVKVWDMDYHYPGFGSPPDEPPPQELDWDFWLGPSPAVPYNRNRYFHHYWFFDYGGGWQLDWAVHHYDIVNWAMGVTEPIAATAIGGKYGFKEDNTEWPDTFSGILEYGPGPVAKKGFILQYTYRGCCRREQRSHGKIFFGSEASMILDRGGYTIRLERELKDVETFRGGPPMHHKVFIDCVRAHKRPENDVESGHHASNPGHLMNIAWKVGRRIRWDGQKEQVLDDPEANALVHKPYRAPWKLEV